MSDILTALEIEQLARFDEHWRVILAGDNFMLVRSLAKRGYLDVLRRRVPRLFFRHSSWLLSPSL